MVALLFCHVSHSYRVNARHHQGELLTSYEITGVCDSTSKGWLSERDVMDSCDSVWLSETCITFAPSTALGLSRSSGDEVGSRLGRLGPAVRRGDGRCDVVLLSRRLEVRSAWLAQFPLRTGRQLEKAEPDFQVQLTHLPLPLHRHHGGMVRPCLSVYQSPNVVVDI